MCMCVCARIGAHNPDYLGSCTSIPSLLSLVPSLPAHHFSYVNSRLPFHGNTTLNVIEDVQSLIWVKTTRETNDIFHHLSYH